MSRLIIISLMVIFALAGTSLWLWFVYGTSESAFHQELVPELVVFCIEAFILVGLLGLIQRHLENRRRRQMRQSLRGSFRDLLSLIDMAFLEPNAEPTSSRELERDPRVIDRLLLELAAKHPDLDSLVALKREGGESLAMTRDLVAVAAQLSATHMNWWIAIVDSIHRLAEACDRRTIEASLQDILINIREFDRLEV
jgi:ABC-type multidrug transport system fused ATPase/permease subunit